MNWKRDGDEITVTMGVDDWYNLAIMMGLALGAALQGRAGPLSVSTVLAVINRLNEGNPGFTPYEITGGPEVVEAGRKV